MPWTAADAERHTKKASTPALQQLWANTANDILEKYGDDARAIRIANSAVERQALMTTSKRSESARRRIKRI